MLLSCRYCHQLLLLRRLLLNQAESDAVDYFIKNLRELLLTAPVRGYAVLAIDPGYSAGCKCALVDPYGDFYYWY